MSLLITFVVGRLGVSRLLAGAVVWAGIALLASGAVFTAYEVIKQRGVDELRTRIEKENQDAIRKGIEASRSLDDCLAAGGVWDFRRQRCSGPALGHR
ncbi:hypothetical protein ACVOMV_25025 [Mesorhizobium atlanticum]